MPGGKAKQEVPRWRRNRQPPGQVVVVRGRAARKLTSALSAPPAAAQPAQPAQGALAATQAFRFRFHLVPFYWAAGVTAAGFALRESHSALLALAAGPLAGLVIVLLTRHVSEFARTAAQALAALAAAWIPLIAFLGLPIASRVAFIACWLAVLIPWVHHYRWRYSEPQQQPEASDVEIWDALAARRKWSGAITGRTEIPGGVRYTIKLNGAETDIGDVMAQPRKIAAAWGKPQTEAFVEPYPTGVESLGYLNLLRESTLQTVHEWDGTGADPQTGLAQIGRYPDTMRAHIRLFAPRDGIRHGMIAGTTGAGKSELLDLLIRVAIGTGFIVPVVLDPQEGQSLPQWRGHLHYACGPAECLDMLRKLHAGMLDRSRYLRDLVWDDGGHQTKGMNFYDPFLSGLPIVMVIGEEMPALLTDGKYGPDAVMIAADIGKRGRKTGVALWPVAQVPSLSELGNNQSLRSMMVGGNVVCLRTGDRVSAGMLSIEADPSQLPRYFPNGEPTYGLGYVFGPDMRQAPFRADLVPAAMRRQAPQVPALDARFAAILDGGPVRPASSPQAPGLSAVPDLPEEEPAPGGRTAADAVLAVILDHGTQMERGEIALAARDLVVKEWGRPKPFAIRSISLALDKLAGEGRIAKVRHGVYAPPRLRAVPGGGEAGA